MPKPGIINYPERRFRHLLSFRFSNYLLLIGFILILLAKPLWIWLLKWGVLAALLIEDGLSLIGLVAFFLFFLWQSYLLDRQTKAITASYPSYLMQYGYFWLIILNILLFLRLDYYYLPLIPGNLGWSSNWLIELGLVAIFIGLQLLVIWARRLKMVPASPELEQLVREVAQRLRVKLKRVRIWKLERVGNAFATGVFFKSVFLTESLVSSASQQDLRMILGHECAHFKQHHLEVRVMLIGCLIFFGSSLIEDFPDLHWFYYLVYGLLAFLIFKAVSRAQEFAADRLAARRLDGPEAMIAALNQVFGVNLTPVRFGPVTRLLLGHPDLEERIKKLSRLKN